jgi:hypothetical protein
MHWGLVVLLGSWGLVMGLLTSLVGLSPLIEAGLWFTAYAVWIPIVLWRRAPPFQTGLAASLLSGMLVGPVQAALFDVYLANNPMYAELVTGTVNEARLGMVAQGIVAGFLFGLFVGGISFGIAWLRGLPLDGQVPAP